MTSYFEHVCSLNNVDRGYVNKPMTKKWYA